MDALPFAFTLSLANVTVMRTGTQIVRDITLSLAPGEAVLLAGPNGSGKTSLLRAIAGFSRFEGRISVKEEPEDTVGDAAPIEGSADTTMHVHLIGHDNGLNRRQGAIEHLSFWRALLDNRRDMRRDEHLNGQSVLDRLGVPGLPVWKLSAGQRQRLALGRLIVAPRAIWLLDEPVTALDAQGRAMLIELCATHRRQGGIIMTSTHGLMDLPDARTLSLVSPSCADDDETREDSAP